MTNYADVHSKDYQPIDVNTYAGVSLVCVGGMFCAMGEINFQPLGIFMSFLSVLFRALRIGQQSYLLRTGGEGEGEQNTRADSQPKDDSIVENGTKSLIIQESLSILYYSCKLDAAFCL